MHSRNKGLAEIKYAKVSVHKLVPFELLTRQEKWLEKNTEKLIIVMVWYCITHHPLCSKGFEWHLKHWYWLSTIARTGYAKVSVYKPIWHNSNGMETWKGGREDQIKTYYGIYWHCLASSMLYSLSMVSKALTLIEYWHIKISCRNGTNSYLEYTI